jgi:tyrosyl-tRNA synthetase
LSDARRTVGQGAVSVNGEKVTSDDRQLADADLLHGRWLLLRKGKRNYHLLDAARHCSS